MLHSAVSCVWATNAQRTLLSALPSDIQWSTEDRVCGVQGIQGMFRGVRLLLVLLYGQFGD